jgi:hypothetical protein
MGRPILTPCLVVTILTLTLAGRLASKAVSAASILPRKFSTNTRGSRAVRAPCNTRHAGHRNLEAGPHRGCGSETNRLECLGIKAKLKQATMVPVVEEFIRRFSIQTFVVAPGSTDAR